MRYSFVLVLFTFLFALSSCGEVTPLELEKVEKFAVNNMSTKGANLELDLLVNNPNSFKVKVLDYKLDVFINNVRIGEANLDKRLVMPRKSISSQHVNVDLKFKNVLFGALPILASLKKGKKAKVRLVGDVKAGTFIFRKNIKVDFEKDVSLTE